ncbi:hypothetical protein BP6252_06691 [Coleophoma cylindrospora]|uniref:Uncharacterized protein n=1 Tax=Coleophoma cylindrospora TaxID=1849047 RepID=A0A3D8RNB6_9HELO|nr:hypothetical protein BP6252_06691 [Coleophoma cylindrospora]
MHLLFFITSFVSLVLIANLAWSLLRTGDQGSEEALTTIAKSNSSSTSSWSSTSHSFSKKWAGVVYSSPPSDEGHFLAVRGELTLPATVSADNTTTIRNELYTVTVWVGLDGQSYQDALLRAGWVPEYPRNFTTMRLAAGDQIALEVNMFNETYGKVGIINWTTRTREFRNVAAPNDGAALRGRNADG